MLYKAESEKKISGFKVAKNAPSVSHPFFADDCFLFSKANMSKAKKILDILQKFGDISGQVINLQKSGIYFSPKMHNKLCKIISRILKIRQISKKKMINT